MQITWNNIVQPENKAEIEKYLLPMSFLIPKWCQTFQVAMYPASENGNNAIETTTLYEYRTIKMYFYASWLNERPEAKQMHVVHDLLHGFTSIFVDYAIAQIDNLCPEGEAEKFNRSMKQQMSILCESMTQDLAYAIMQKFGSLGPVGEGHF